MGFATHPWVFKVSLKPTRVFQKPPLDFFENPPMGFENPRVVFELTYIFAARISMRHVNTRVNLVEFAFFHLLDD